MRWSSAGYRGSGGTGITRSHSERDRNRIEPIRPRHLPVDARNRAPGSAGRPAGRLKRTSLVRADLGRSRSSRSAHIPAAASKLLRDRVLQHAVHRPRRRPVSSTQDPQRRDPDHPPRERSGGAARWLRRRARLRPMCSGRPNSSRQPVPYGICNQLSPGGAAIRGLRTAPPIRSGGIVEAVAQARGWW